jgi:hypothetical protein
MNATTAITSEKKPNIKPPCDRPGVRAYRVKILNVARARASRPENRFQAVAIQ